MRLGLVAGPVLIAIALISESPLATAQPASAKLGAEEVLQTIRVPPGYSVDIAAAPPLVERPMMATFDERGRLYVCDSSGFNLTDQTSQYLVDNPQHMIRLLEDTDGNGTFDKSTVFADKLTFPMGALSYRGSLFVASAPSLLKLTDTNADGIADLREEFVSKFQFVGNACDIHGPFLGPDGYIYWANCIRDFEIKQKDGSTLSGTCSGIFRVKPDGSEVELVCAGGMDNPVEVVFSDEGEAMATVDLFLSSPRDDAIIHGVEGGLFPYREISPAFKRTGSLLPGMISLGWVAPAGLARIRGAGLGELWSGNLMSAQFNRRRVQRHPIERVGATFAGKSEDFLVSDYADFHPTDVIEDADGSLLVVDTGGWFVRGCPTSRVAKPELLGAIFRVRKNHAEPVADGWGQQVDWGAPAAELVALLDDPRPFVQDRAVEELSQRGDGAVQLLADQLQQSFSVTARRNAVWALNRSSAPQAIDPIRNALSNHDPSVRQVAAACIGLKRDTEAWQALTHLVTTDRSLPVRRQAATALGRLNNPLAVPALLDAAAQAKDRFLEHAIIYALIQIADRPQTAEGLSHPHPLSQKAALIALDQMEGGNLSQAEVARLLASTATSVQQAALDIVTKHVDWADSVTGLIDSWLRTPEMFADRQAGMKQMLVSLAKDPHVQAIAAGALQREETAVEVRQLVLDAMGQAQLSELPSEWRQAIAASLGHADERVVSQAIAAIRLRRSTEFDEPLLRVANQTEKSAPLRLAALQVAAPRMAALEERQFEFLRSQFADEQPLTRVGAADALGKSQLNDEQLIQLTQQLPAAGPAELPLVLTAFERANAASVGMALVESLRQNQSLVSLAPEALERTMAPYPDNVRSQAEPLFMAIHQARGQQSARLADLEKLLTAGDERQGRSLFFGGRATCSACHTVQDQGGKIGPDLSKIGGIRTRRDLLESIVFPSNSFVRGYEHFSVSTHTGLAHTGLLARETSDTIILVGADRTEIQIARDDIDQLEPAKLSIMPQGLETQLSPEELGNLLAFLMSLK